MLRRLLALSLFCLCAAHAVDAPDHQLADMLVAATGTAAVVDDPRVQAALADPQPFLGPAGQARRERLLAEAGLRAWQGPRVWVLQSRREGEAEHWSNAGLALEGQARQRGYGIVKAQPLPSAEAAFGFLVPGTPAPALGTLLGAYGADVLVLLRGEGWSLWAGPLALHGALPPRAELLPEFLAELLAARQQWPEARGRTVLQVKGVAGLAELAAVQASLQALPDLQPQLMRVAPGQAWFAVALGPEAAAKALEVEPRLPAVAAGRRVLPALVTDARRLACPLLVRQWQPEAAPPAGTPAPSEAGPE